MNLAANNSFSILEFLNNNSGAIQAVSTVILVIITGVYVFLTWRLSSVSKSQLLFQKESEERNLKQKIVESVLKWFFRFTDELDNVNNFLQVYLRDKKESHRRVKKSKQEYENRLTALLEDRNVISELQLVGFNVNRLNDIELINHFRKTQKALMDVVHNVASYKNIDEYKSKYSEYKNLEKALVKKCIDICKVDSIKET